jgi:hypothetical protein
VLQQPVLRDRLRSFCDPDATPFAFPTSRDDARAKWAAAFATYISTIEEALTRPPPPPDQHPSLNLAAVATQFRSTLQLDRDVNTTPEATANDFASAWAAAVGPVGITPTPAGVTDASMRLYLFSMFTNVATQRTRLYDALVAIFRTTAPSSSETTVARLGRIATAFHDATRGLRAQMPWTLGAATGTAIVDVR